MELLLGSGSGGTGRVVHRRVPALAVCPAQVRQVLLGEHRRQHRDPAAVYPDLAVAQGAAQHDTAATRGVRPGRVLDLATAGAAQVPVVDRGVLGQQQLDHAVVDVHGDLDVAVGDAGGAQVEYGDAAVVANLEAPLGGP